MGHFRFLPKVNPCAVDHSKRKLQPLPGRPYDHLSHPHPRIPGCGPPGLRRGCGAALPTSLTPGSRVAEDQRTPGKVRGTRGLRAASALP